MLYLIELVYHVHYRVIRQLLTAVTEKASTLSPKRHILLWRAIAGFFQAGSELCPLGCPVPLLSESSHPWLKQQESVLSQFWRLKTKITVSVGLESPEGCEGKELFQASLRGW